MKRSHPYNAASRRALAQLEEKAPIRTSRSRNLRRFVAEMLACVLVTGLIVTTPAALADMPPVDLDDAAPFAVLAGSSVTNTGQTAITGDLGVSPGTTVSGFPPGTVSGTIHTNDSTAIAAKA